VTEAAPARRRLRAGRRPACSVGAMRTTDEWREGPHTARGEVHDQLGHRTSATWTFVVPREHHDAGEVAERKRDVERRVDQASPPPLTGPMPAMADRWRRPGEGEPEQIRGQRQDVRRRPGGGGVRGRPGASMPQLLSDQLGGAEATVAGQGRPCGCHGRSVGPGIDRFERDSAPPRRRRGQRPVRRPGARRTRALESLREPSAIAALRRPGRSGRAPAAAADGGCRRTGRRRAASGAVRCAARGGTSRASGTGSPAAAPLGERTGYGGRA